VFPRLERALVTRLQSLSALHANLVPLEFMLDRLGQGGKLPEIYLRTYANRERSADYRLVKQPDFYVRRVMRVLAVDLPDSAFQNMDTFADAVLKTGRQRIRPWSASSDAYRQAASAIARLQQRGSRVSVVRFPSSGLVRGLEDLAEPVSLWRQVMSQLGASASIDFRDYPLLQYELADGSHLDQRQKGEFTSRLLALLLQLGGLKQ